jgi:GNAT superfamily N-acetyltransferase
MKPEPYRPAQVDARVATASDLDAVAETMARAFFGDPVWGWAFADADRRLEQQRAVWRLAIGSALGYDWVWLTAGCASAALWIPPGKPELQREDEERFEPLLRDLCGDGAARVLETCERFERAHPRERPHYYLSLLATHPDHAGRGLGMGLLADNLARIDAEGTPAYLESSNPANERRYERHGFVRCGVFDLSEDGPSVTQMWREPA